MEATIQLHVQTTSPFPKSVQVRACAGIILIDLSKAYADIKKDIQKSFDVLDKETRCDENFSLYAYGMPPDPLAERNSPEE